MAWDLMGGWKKKLFGTKIDYPDAILRDAYPGKAASNIRTGGLLNKLDWDWKDGIEALNELKQPEYPKLAASRSGGPRPRLPGYTQTNMGAYGGDLVEQQAAMAKARREEELQRRMKLLGGGY